MKNKKDAYSFFNTKKQIAHYTDIYNQKPNFKLDYPANKKRLEITIKQLKKINPKKILDAGCGNGLPLINIKKKGFCKCKWKYKYWWIKRSGNIY